MTLDSAIVEYEQKANMYEEKVNYLDEYKNYMNDYDDDREYYIKQKIKYIQLALWLKELRVRRNNSCSCYDEINIRSQLDDNVGRIWERGRTAYEVLKDDNSG